MRILTLGGSGQVGRELRARAESSLHDLLCPSSTLLDIRDRPAVRAFFHEHRPDFCVNLAAYTDVAAAEQNPTEAFDVNCKGAVHVADAAASLGIPLIHISTDYVFDGQQDRPYREDDPPNPLNVYGNSKLAGEVEIRRRCSDYLIIRTSWVFSRWDGNFVKTIVQRARSGPELHVVDDEIGGPTSAADLAGALLEIIARHETGAQLPWGLYHCSNEGSASRFELADRIMRRVEERVGGGGLAEVLPVSTDSRPVSVRRPGYSVLDTGKIRGRLGVRMRPWTEAVDEVVDQLLAGPEPEGST